jgi:hypothetical protein
MPVARTSALQAARARKGVRHLWIGSLVTLAPAAGVAAALSFESLYRVASPIFGPLAVGYPLLADTVILGATLAYLAGASSDAPHAGWRWTAHGGIAATLVLNALTASTPSGIVWHVIPPAVWSVLVEMTARQVTPDQRQREPGAAEPLPLWLWLMHPMESLRILLHMARTGQRSHRQARLEMARWQAAAFTLELSTPGRPQRRVRRLLQRHLRAGTLNPRTVLALANRLPEDADSKRHSLVLLEALLTASGVQTSALSRSTTAPVPKTRVSAGVETRIGSPLVGGGTRSDNGRAEHAGNKRIMKGSGDLSAERYRATRARALSDIVAAHPDIAGVDLAHKLTAQGWRISARTARRLRAAMPQTPQSAMQE